MNFSVLEILRLSFQILGKFMAGELDFRSDLFAVVLIYKSELMHKYSGVLMMRKEP